LVWLAIFIGTAAAYLTDTVVLSVLVLSCMIGLWRSSVFWLLPLAILSKLYIAWHGFSWRRMAGLPQSQEVPDYFYGLFVLSVLCILAWSLGRIVSRGQTKLP
jgi:hypothetical protein